MLKKTITYENVFTGESISEDCYFHLSQAEIVEIELSHTGGLKESLLRIIAAEDGKGIVDEFKSIIMLSYGQRSDDGRRFIKNDTIRDEFKSTGAYSALFMELVTDTDAAIEFVTGIIPTGMSEAAAKLVSADLKLVDDVVDEVKGTEKVVTKTDIEKMSEEELADLWPKVRSGEVELNITTELSPVNKPSL